MPIILRRSIFISVFRRMENLSSSRPSSDLAAFQLALSKARHVAVITGAGVSAESGVPTFRGHGGFWRRYQAQDLATPEAFQRDPGLVWEFYHYRRDLVLSKKPNAAHYAVSNLESKFEKIGRQVTVITQNIDELHIVAGTKSLIELHGSLFKTMCTSCKDVRQDRRNPICQALAGKGAPEADANEIIDPKLLPRCTICDGLLRPYVVWFGENLDAKVLKSAQEVMRRCDFCIVVGTSAVVYPAALLAPEAAARGVPVAEFNIEKTPTTSEFDFYFEGPAGITLPEAMGITPI